MSDQQQQQTQPSGPSTALSAFIKGGLVGGLGIGAGIAGVRAFGGPQGERKVRDFIGATMQDLKEKGSKYKSANIGQSGADDVSRMAQDLLGRDKDTAVMK